MLFLQRQDDGYISAQSKGQRMGGEHPAPIIRRATHDEVTAAFALVSEYYEAVGVLVRENLAEFTSQYFGEGAGVWLAYVQDEAVGCVALRKLQTSANSGEIKRMYVRATHRGQGIAGALLAALEKFATAAGYHWLYLDTASSMIEAARFYQRSNYQACEPYNDNPQAALFLRKLLR
jgi:GNAT superfamily N-acetyltransferase